jgi:hypothetical protein
MVKLREYFLELLQDNDEDGGVSRRPTINLNKIAGLHKGSVWRRTISQFEREIHPIMEKLYDDNFDQRIKISLKKYLVIALVAMVEQYFINEARRVVDEYDMDISTILKGRISIPISDFDKMKKEGILTKGNIVASSFNFGNPHEIDNVFTHLLNFNFKFFEVIQKVDRSSRARYVFRGRPININYKKFMEVFRLRHLIVHEMKDIQLSNSQLVLLWDNTMNILDAASMIVMPDNRKHVEQVVEEQAVKESKLEKIH